MSSRQVVLLLSGALATTGGLSGCAEDPEPPAPPPGVKLVSQEQLDRDLRDNKEEENNSYVPGLGYYHSLYHGWFPYPFNYFFAGRGYYRGGDWNDSAWSGVVPPRSRPNWSEVTDTQPGTGSGYFHSGGSTYSGGSESGISRAVFTSPHSSSGGFSFGGGHGGGE